MGTYDTWLSPLLVRRFYSGFYGAFQKLGALFGSLYDKDRSVFVFVLEPPMFGHPDIEST